jgi:hypothetical protein
MFVSNKNSMNTNQPKITDGYPISVPLNEYYTCPAVYKIVFGKKYFIWKGKSLLQSCEAIGKQLHKPVSLKELPLSDNHLFHVVSHIIKTRCMSGSVQVLDYNKTPLQLIKREQQELDKAINDPNCLNNNEQAYVPVTNHFINEGDKQRFLKWYEETRPKPKKKKK